MECAFAAAAATKSEGVDDSRGIGDADMSVNTSTALTTPVLLLIHARPDTTQLVFESIRSIRPGQLFVAADGPRQDVAGEEQKCAEARHIATGR